MPNPSTDPDAEALAASYGYDADALLYECNRRAFGSFTTTLDGSSEQRDRFQRAWLIALSRQPATGADHAA